MQNFGNVGTYFVHHYTKVTEFAVNQAEAGAQSVKWYQFFWYRDIQ